MVWRELQEKYRDSFIEIEGWEYSEYRLFKQPDDLYSERVQLLKHIHELGDFFDHES